MIDFWCSGALKMLRTVLAVKDDFYNRYIVREKVLDRVVECFVRNGARYNLLNSAMLELFDYIRSVRLHISFYGMWLCWLNEMSER